MHREVKGLWKRPRGQFTFLLPMCCSHGKDPEISLLIKITTGCPGATKLEKSPALLHPLRQERVRVS